MSDLENNTFTNETNIKYPSLEDTADVRVINNNIRILNETKANLDNLVDVARETKPKNIEDMVTENSANIKELKESLNNVLEKITEVSSKNQSMIISGIDHNSFISDMALNGRLFVLSSLHSSNIDMEVTFPSYTRVVANRHTYSVENDAPSQNYNYNSRFFSHKPIGDFLFNYCHFPAKISNLIINDSNLENIMVELNYLHVKYPIEIINNATRKSFQNSYYLAFILDNLEDLDKIKVQVKDSSTNETLSNVIQLNQVTSISFKNFDQATSIPTSAYSRTLYDWTYKILKRL